MRISTDWSLDLQPLFSWWSQEVYKIGKLERSVRCMLRVHVPKLGYLEYPENKIRTDAQGVRSAPLSLPSLTMATAPTSHLPQVNELRIVPRLNLFRTIIIS